MTLLDTHRDWDALGRDDPLWAVLTERGRRGRRWTREEFLATGRQEIAEALELAEQVGAAPRRGRALDFGCGAGRLTQALAAEFEQAVGVDIAPSMLAAARSLAPDEERCSFRLNTGQRLEGIDDGEFDFAYSARVLQHMPRANALAYIGELLRILRPGGTLMFQLPTHPAPTLPGLAIRVLPSPVAGRLRKLYARSAAPMDMHGTAPAVVERTVEAAGGRVVHAVADDKAGPHWRSTTYVVVKEALPR
jgi:SAM-dependent methyltransferase